MSMKAIVRTDVSGNIIIQMNGGLDYETNIPLKNELLSLIKQYPSSTITLDFYNVDFVGSSGINYFVEMVNTLNQKNLILKLTNVKQEFIKVFKLYQMSNIESIVEDINRIRIKEIGQNILNE
ncbi:MAG: STAS domain-containing protein [Oligoflexia bacterium]|nr:STAS domain-containing protein [Oligoflexia bacterium]